MKWNKDIDQVQTDIFTYYYYEENGRIHLDLKTLEGDQDESYLGNICSADDESWEEKIETFIKEFESSEENISFARRLNTEVRTARISINKKGGTAGKESIGYRVILPNAWMQQMGITEDEREVILTFDGEKIIIKKQSEIDEE